MLRKVRHGDTSLTSSRVIMFQILLVTILVLGSSAGPLKRNKRSLGLLKLGYDWATQGLSAGLSEGLITGFSDLSTGGKIGAGLLMAKPVALTLLGKCNEPPLRCETF